MKDGRLWYNSRLFLKLKSRNPEVSGAKTQRKSVLYFTFFKHFITTKKH